ncbi:MAG: GTPase HflX [Bacteroidales bacterium]|nr:GTPase HflX [Bacteroidales bacterium]
MVARERTILVGLILFGQSAEKTKEYLDELEFLAYTAQAEVVARFVQRLPKPDPQTFIGKGKLEEIASFVHDNQIQLAIFDDNLTPSQVREIEKVLRCRVIDRTNLILDIFALRARTAYAKAQVELAQLQYMLPRLTRMWTHLERQRGGIGLRGPGEQEIETDRRRIKERIAKLKEELEFIGRQKQTQRKHRKHLIRVSLVGYTNVGKSTLMNLLSKSNVFVENKLFATLDTTVRKVTFNQLAFLLSDTVGFIRKLPHQLVESFKSTLDEVRDADILLHVVDVSHPSFAEQIHTVQTTLEDIGAIDKPMLMVFNKIDALPELDIEYLNRLCLEYENVYRCRAIYISALKKIHIELLKNSLFEMVKEIHTQRYPGTIPWYS